MKSLTKNSLAKTTLILVGLFLTIVIIFIAVDVSKRTPETILTTNATPEVEDNLIVEAVPVQQPARVFSATGLIDGIAGPSLTITATIFVSDEVIEKQFIVSTNENTQYSQLDQGTRDITSINFNQLAVRDEVTFRSNDDLSQVVETTATFINKLIN